MNNQINDSEEMNVNETTLKAIEMTAFVNAAPLISISTPFGAINPDLLDYQELACVFFFLVNLHNEGADSAKGELAKLENYIWWCRYMHVL